MTICALCISNKVEVSTKGTYGVRAAEVTAKSSQVRHTEKENFWRQVQVIQTDLIPTDKDAVFILMGCLMKHKR